MFLFFDTYILFLKSFFNFVVHIENIERSIGLDFGFIVFIVCFYFNIFCYYIVFILYYVKKLKLRVFSTRIIIIYNFDIERIYLTYCKIIKYLCESPFNCVLKKKYFRVCYESKIYQFFICFALKLILHNDYIFLLRCSYLLVNSEQSI
jgi:hypothetical protein